MHSKLPLMEIWETSIPTTTDNIDSGVTLMNFLPNLAGHANVDMIWLVMELPKSFLHHSGLFECLVLGTYQRAVRV